MINQKVLVVAPYPIAKPRHGGQKRAEAIYKYYKSLFSDVVFVGVFHRGQYPDWGESDILLGDISIISQIDKKPYASEIISGKAIDKDIHVRSYFAELLKNFQPDIIHIEQPYPYLGIRVLLKELGMNPKIVFGSQNIEYILKERICNELNVSKKVSQEIIQDTREVEEKLSREASLVVAVNKEDATFHRSVGAKRCIVAPNGISITQPSAESNKFWSEFKKKNKVSKLVAFVGSGHPPNWMGFVDVVGLDLSFLPEDSKIVIAGGVASHFKKESKANKSFWRKVELVENIEDDLLGGLIYASDVILLPILTERGSNLKTAEAILSRKKIVATQFALRGFEDYLDLPNLYMAKELKSFNALLARALDSPYKKPTKAQETLADQVKWENCLKPMEPGLRAVSKRSIKYIVITKLLTLKSAILHAVR